MIPATALPVALKAPWGMSMPWNVGATWVYEGILAIKIII
jgi:hypothetical protein